ncbi:MAG: sarcosine oxidase subunit alpha, partial [Mesorhizobium sp.]
MMAGAMRSYLNRFAVAPGQRTAIFTTNDSGYALARDLEAAGVGLAAVIDSRADAAFAYTGKARLITGAVVSDARGGKALAGVNVTTANGATEAIALDALAMSGGFSPIIHLACHRGGKPQWSDAHGAFMAPSETRGLALAGAVAGTTGLSASFAEGAVRGVVIAKELGFAPQAFGAGPVDGDIVAPPARPLWNIRGVKRKAFVDFQNDVGRKDLGLAVQEGYGDVELAKRYTTSGMATDQGKL